MDTVEKDLRIQLAACYRIFDYLGWSELIFNHITVRIPGDKKHFLINPYGLHYSEVCASNLVKVDIDGNIVEHSNYRVNPAGMLIHSTIHDARDDVHCVAHVHTTAGSAVSCLKGGLRHDNFYSVLLYNKIAYHDFEGITVMQGEKQRLLSSLGDKNILILRNHGLLTCGKNIAETFFYMWALQRSCEIQLAVDSTGKSNIPIAEDIAEVSEQLLNIQTAGAEFGELEFAAMTRVVDKLDPSYKD